MNSRKCLVVGCGYLGARVARQWRDQGLDVSVTTRSSGRAEHFLHQGLKPIVIDVTDSASSAVLPAADLVLFAVGYDRTAGPSQREVYVDGLRATLDRLNSLPQTFIYISSTGVYGQANGSWVDEESACNPTRAGGQICLEAERLLKSHDVGRSAIILRLAGIYGPGRIPYIKRLRTEQSLAVPRTGYLNLIHVEDAVQVVTAATRMGVPPDIFAVSDGHPVVRQEFYDEIGRQLNLDVSYRDPDSGDSRVERAMASKRVANRRMLEKLKVTLQYPTYVDGLRAILNTDVSCDGE